MGWSVGYDEKWKRWIGYGVPAICDYPNCNEEIDRGLAYVCGSGPYGGDHGCGLYFCHEHLHHPDCPWPIEGGRQFCGRCTVAVEKAVRIADGFEMPDAEPFEPTPDVEEWVRHMLTDASWGDWRQENPAEVARMKEALARG